MSKQIYIDSNGNEIQVSGTVNTADMMPMSASDSTKVSEAIGDLSSLNTVDKSSLVNAVNEVNRVNGATITANAGYTVGAQRLVKQGKTVMLQATFVADNAFTEGRKNVGTVAADFRPYTNITFICSGSSALNSFSNRMLTGIITTAGEILVGDMVAPSGQSVKEVRMALAYEQGN